MIKAPKLAEIAQRIARRLSHMEMKDPARGTAHSRYWHSTAWPAGSRVAVRYVSFQSESKLTKADALEYLAWLDAGNEGTHYKALSFNVRIREDADAR